MAPTYTVYTPMPKLLVLFDARSEEIARRADAIADGARSVRFAEVDIRRIARRDAALSDAALPDAGGIEAGGRLASRHRVLESADALGSYDGIIVGAAASDVENEAVRELIASCTVSLANKVACAFTVDRTERRRAALWSVLIPMADRAMIIAPPRAAEPGDDDDEAARKLGKRVTDIVGWITHSRSHHHHH